MKKKSIAAVSFCISALLMAIATLIILIVFKNIMLALILACVEFALLGFGTYLTLSLKKDINNLKNSENNKQGEQK